MGVFETGANWNLLDLARDLRGMPAAGSGDSRDTK